MNPDSEFGDRLFIAEDEAEALSERRSPEESSALGVEREKGYPKSVPKDSKRTKSRLPSSLKTNIIRSRAKFHELETSGSNVTSTQTLPRRPAIVRFSRKDDQAQVVLTTGNELASDIGTGADENRNLKRATRKTKSKQLVGSTRRSSVFQKNRMDNEGSLAYLIDPVKSAPRLKPKIRRSRMKVQPSGEVISVELVGPSTNISARKATKPKKPPRTVGRSKNSIAENAISNTGSSEGILTSLDFLEHNVRKSRKRRDEGKKRDKGTRKRARSATSQTLQLEVEHSPVANIEQRCTEESVTTHAGDGVTSEVIEVEETERNLSRAARRKLTQSLLREGNSNLKRSPRKKKAPLHSIHKEMQPTHSGDINSNNVETFDTFLKYPMDVPYPQTIEGFCSTSGRQENCFYENYRASVRGKGVFMSDLEDVVKKRIADTEKEIAKWSSLARKLEEQDCLGTDPFIDYIAYRFHPLNTRGELRRWFGMHEEQFKTNSGVLSVMPGALWYLKETKHIFIARYERDLDTLSAQLDEYCGRQQGRENEQQIDPVHLDIIREKIDDVYQRLQDYRLSSQAVELKSGLIENPISVPGQCLKSNVAGERVIKEEEPVFGADLSSTENSDIEEGIRFFDFKEETQ